MSKLEADFLEAWHAYPGLVEPVCQHRFHDVRKFRFDFCWPDYMVAVDIQGFGGGHLRFKAYSDDCDKANLATNLGWRFLRFTAAHLSESRREEMVQVILEAIGKSPNASQIVTGELPRWRPFIPEL